MGAVLGQDKPIRFSGSSIACNITARPYSFTVTIGTEEGNVTVKITSATQFQGNVASNFNGIVIGHEIQAEFFAVVNEAVKVETNFPE